MVLVMRVLSTFVVVHSLSVCVQALVCYEGSEVAVLHLILNPDPVSELVVKMVVCATVIKCVISLEIVVLMF